MRLMITVSDARTGSASNVLLEADESAPLTGIVPQLAAAVAADLHPGALSLAVDGRIVPMSEPLSTAGMREGSSVVVGTRDALTAWETTPEDALVQLRVVSGDGAGTALHAWRGITTIGSSADAALRIDDRSRLAAIELVVDIAGADSVTVRPAGAETAATLDGEAIAASTSPTPWPLGGQLSIAGRLIELALPDDDLAAFVPSEQGGGIDYNRPPRILPPESATSLRLPAPPRDLPARPLPIIAALMPLVMAAGSAILLRNYFFLIIAALSPVMLIGNYLMSKRSGKKSRRARCRGSGSAAVPTPTTCASGWAPRRSPRA
jgi:S-DNA-T family DNA segregation ATPase FtsK/SpoIIIE